jgi:hypothetical protein
MDFAPLFKCHEAWLGRFEKATNWLCISKNIGNLGFYFAIVFRYFILITSCLQRLLV